MWPTFRLFILLLFTLSAVCSALEIDEIISLRILKVSDTKKTILINRGLEDGLIIGDHAKFFLTTGVVARGTMIKGSPTRSIWSIYRLIEAGMVVRDNVLNMKIATPIKVTKDKSHMLSPEATITTGKHIPAARGYSDISEELNEEESRDFDMVRRDSRSKVERYDSYTGGIAREQSIELWTLFDIDYLKVNSKLASESTTYGGANNFDFSMAIEKYATNVNSWVHRWTGEFIVHYQSDSMTGLTGHETTSGVFEYGLGFNFHVLADAQAYHKLIGFWRISGGLGTCSDVTNVNNSGQNSYSKTYKGANNFFTFGYGLKYYLPWGFGLRGIFEYYRRGETYMVDGDERYTKVISGPRFLFGLSYRW